MIKQVTYQEAQALMASRQAIIFADVRDKDSYEKGHIENAVHLSMAKLQDFYARVDKEQPIVVYCYHGISSQSVAALLVEQGYVEVYSLKGGYEAWKQHHTASKDKS